VPKARKGPLAQVWVHPTVLRKLVRSGHVEVIFKEQLGCEIYILARPQTTETARTPRAL
jgi:hypothetical protein